MRAFLCSMAVMTAGAVSVLGDASVGVDVAAQDLAIRQGVLQLQAVAGPLQTATLENVMLDDQPFAGDRAYVLQLDGPLTPLRRAELSAVGVTLGDYLPNYAYVVSLDGVAGDTLRDLGFVSWVGRYQDAWKIAPGIGDRMYHTDERQALRDAGRVIVDVTLFAGQTDEAVDAILGDDDLALLRADVYGEHIELGVEISVDNVASLAGHNSVQFVEEAPDVGFRNDTIRWIAQSNANNNTPLYDAGLRGEGQIAGVMDGKIDSGHCSFANKIVAYNTTNGSDFHGTHVGATVVGDNGVDNNLRGVAYNGTLVFDDVPSFTNNAIYNALQLHHDQGARIHTNSWGDDGTTAYNGLTRGIDRFSYDNEDSLVLFAVTNLGSLRNPDNAKNLLAVGASQDTPNQGNHCSGGVGPTSDGRRKPEVYLPGCGTLSADDGTNCGVTSLTGTSMACPAVAGATMLARQYYMEGFYPSGTAQAADAFTPSGALLKATIVNSTVDMTGVAGYPSNLEGWGRVRLDRSLALPGGDRQLFVDDLRNASGMSTGETIQYEVDVTDATPKLKITLVWTEPAAASGAASAPINDLDLVVISPGGSTYRGNAFSGGESTTGGSADAINNVEQVHVSSPATGVWTIRVNATAVNNGPQGYAVVATGAITPDVPFSVALPSSPPDLIAPNVTTDFSVEIVPGNEAIASADLVYSIDGASDVSSALVPAGGDLYTATLPALDCGQTLAYHVIIAGVDSTVRTEPADFPASRFMAEVGEQQIPVDDMFEVDSGWTVGDPSDTATAGIWNRMDPEATAAQPENDRSPSGTDCWVTDGVGGALGAADVDNGATTLYSPMFDLSGSEIALVSYWRWFSNDTGANPRADVFRVDISNDGSNWVNVETVGPDGDENSGGWIQHEFSVTDFVALNSTIQLRFIAEDAGASSLVEAAIDDLLIRTRSCGAGSNCATDFDGSGTVDLSDLAILLGNFGQGSVSFADGDSDGDGDVDLTDLANVLAEFGRNC